MLGGGGDFVVTLTLAMACHSGIFSKSTSSVPRAPPLPLLPSLGLACTIGGLLTIGAIIVAETVPHPAPPLHTLPGIWPMVLGRTGYWFWLTWLPCHSTEWTRLHFVVPKGGRAFGMDQCLV